MRVDGLWSQPRHFDEEKILLLVPGINPGSYSHYHIKRTVEEKISILKAVSLFFLV
jgi:hypothetical protein